MQGNQVFVNVVLYCEDVTFMSSILSPTDEEKAKQDPSYHLKSTNMETRETLAELYRDYKGDELLASTMKEPVAKKTDKLNAVSVLRYCFSSCSQWQSSLLFVFIDSFLFSVCRRFEVVIYHEKHRL